MTEFTRTARDFVKQFANKSDHAKKMILLRLAEFDRQFDNTSPNDENSRAKIRSQLKQYLSNALGSNVYVPVENKTQVVIDNTHVEELKKYIFRLQGTNNQLNVVKANLWKERNAFKNDLKQANTDKKTLETDKKTLETDKKTLETDKKTLETDKKRLERKIHSLNEEIRKLKLDVETLQALLREKNQTIEADQKDLQDLNARIAALTANIETKKQEHEQLQEINTNLAAVIDNMGVVKHSYSIVDVKEQEQEQESEQSINPDLDKFLSNIKLMESRKLRKAISQTSSNDDIIKHGDLYQTSGMIKKSKISRQIVSALRKALIPQMKEDVKDVDSDENTLREENKRLTELLEQCYAQQPMLTSIPMFTSIQEHQPTLTAVPAMSISIPTTDEKQVMSDVVSQSTTPPNIDENKELQRLRAENAKLKEQISQYTRNMIDVQQHMDEQNTEITKQTQKIIDLLKEIDDLRIITAQLEISEQEKKELNRQLEECNVQLGKRFLEVKTETKQNPKNADLIALMEAEDKSPSQSLFGFDLNLPPPSDIKSEYELSITDNAWSTAFNIGMTEEHSDLSSNQKVEQFFDRRLNEFQKVIDSSTTYLRFPALFTSNIKNLNKSVKGKDYNNAWKFYVNILSTLLLEEFQYAEMIKRYLRSKIPQFDNISVFDLLQILIKFYQGAKFPKKNSQIFWELNNLARQAQNDDEKKIELAQALFGIAKESLTKQKEQGTDVKQVDIAVVDELRKNIEELKIDHGAEMKRLKEEVQKCTLEKKTLENQLNNIISFLDQHIDKSKNESDDYLGNIKKDMDTLLPVVNRLTGQQHTRMYDALDALVQYTNELKKVVKPKKTTLATPSPAETKEQIAEWKAKITELEGKNSELNIKLINQTTEIKNNEKEIGDLKNECKIREQTIQTLKLEIDNLKAQLNHKEQEHKKALDEKNEELNKLSENNDKCSDDLANTRKSLRIAKNLSNVTQNDSLKKSAIANLNTIVTWGMHKLNKIYDNSRRSKESKEQIMKEWIALSYDVLNQGIYRFDDRIVRLSTVCARYNENIYTIFIEDNEYTRKQLRYEPEENTFTVLITKLKDEVSKEQESWDNMVSYLTALINEDTGRDALQKVIEYNTVNRVISSQLSDTTIPVTPRNPISVYQFPDDDEKLQYGTIEKTNVENIPYIDFSDLFPEKEIVKEENKTEESVEDLYGREYDEDDEDDNEENFEENENKKYGVDVNPPGDPDWADEEDEFSETSVWKKKTPTESTQTPTESTQTPTESTQTPTESTQTPTESTQTPTESTQTPTESTQTQDQSKKRSRRRKRGGENQPYTGGENPQFVNGAQDPGESGTLQVIIVAVAIVLCVAWFLCAAATWLSTYISQCTISRKMIGHYAYNQTPSVCPAISYPMITME